MRGSSRSVRCRSDGEWLSSAPRPGGRELVTDQRHTGGETSPRGDFGAQVSAQQVKYEFDRRLTPGHVVMQVGIQAVVAGIQLGREARQQDIDIEGGQAEQAGQLSERQPHPEATARGHAFGNAGRQRIEHAPHRLRDRGRDRDGFPGRRTGSRTEDVVHFGFGNVEGGQLLPGAIRSLPSPPYLHLEQGAETLQLREQVLKRCAVAVHRQSPAQPSVCPGPEGGPHPELLQVDVYELAHVSHPGEVSAATAGHVSDPTAPGGLSARACRVAEPYLDHKGMCVRLDRPRAGHRILVHGHDLPCSPPDHLLCTTRCAAQPSARSSAWPSRALPRAPGCVR